MVFINQRTLSFLSTLLLFLLSPLTAHCTLSLESDDWNVCLQGGLGVHSEFRNLVTLLRVMTKAEWQASENNGWPMVRVILSEPFFQLYNKWFEPYAPIVSESTIKTEAGVLGQPEDGRGGAGDSGERQIRCMSAFDNKSGFFVQSSPQALKAVVKKLQLKSEVVAEARGIIASKYSTGLVAVHGTTNARACETAQQR